MAQNLRSSGDNNSPSSSSKSDKNERQKLIDTGAGFFLDDEDDLEASASSQNKPVQLTQEQLSRIDKNRKRALDIKRSKESEAKVQKLMEKNEHKKLIDTGAGFYLDEDDLEEEIRKETQIVIEPSVPIPSDFLTCNKCCKRFPRSYLSEHFDVNVCDCCRSDFPDEYKLITKTEALEEFLLKDCDLNMREPVLKYIAKKNPHQNRWGEMKLYLRSQIVERALVVHEDLKKLEEKKEERSVNLHKTRQKNYEKKVKTLRKEARLGARKLVKYHEHEFGEGVYNEEEDNYYKVCQTCDFRVEYEEL